MTEKQLDSLDKLIGENFMYNGRNLMVTSYATNDGQVRIINTGQTIVFPEDKVDEKLSEFLPADGPKLPVSRKGAMTEKGAMTDLIKNQHPTIDRIEQILCKNIEKLQKEDGEKFIPQAREISTTTNALVKMTRMKLEIIRESRKFNS